MNKFKQKRATDAKAVVESAHKSLWNKILIAVSFVILFCYLALAFSHFLTIRVGGHDECMHLTAAHLISRGMIPHIDFFTEYPPLNYYLIRMVFSWLGPSAVSGRILQESLFVIVIICTYFGFKTFFVRGATVSLFLTLVSTVLMANIFTYAWWNSYAIAFLGMMFFIFSLHARRWQIAFLLASGLLTGLACLAKLNFGSYVAAAGFLSLAVGSLHTRESRPESIRKTVCFLVPVFLCVLGYLISYHDSVKEVLDQILIFPSLGLEKHRIVTLPEGINRYGTLVSVVFPLIWVGLRSVQLTSRLDRCALIALSSAILSGAALFIIGTQYPELLPKFFLLIAAMVVLLQMVFSRLEEDEFVILIVYSLFTNYFLSRIDAPHFTVMLPLAVILFPYLLQEKEPAGNRFYAGIARYSCAALIIALCISPAYWHLNAIVSHPRENLSSAYKLLKLRQEIGKKSDSELLISSDFSSTPFARLYPNKAELQAIRFLSKHTAPEDPVYVGVEDHSRVYINPTRLFWVTGRNIGVKYYILEPGFTTEELIQRRMIADLKDRKVGWMILRSNRQGDEDFERRNYRGAKTLDDYIRENYKPVQKFGNLTVYKIKSSFG